MGYTRQEMTNQRQWFVMGVHQFPESLTNQRQWKHGVHKTRKDKPETVETWGTQDKKGQARDQWKHGVHKTRKDPRDSLWKHGVHKTRKDKPETVETWGTLDKKGQSRDSGNMGLVYKPVETLTKGKKGQTRDSGNMGYTRQEMTFPETVDTWGTQDKKGQTRVSGNMGVPHHCLWCPFLSSGPHGNMGYTRQERTNQRHCLWNVLSCLGTQDKKGQTRDSGSMGYTRQERTNQRQWKHGVHFQERTNQRPVETWGTLDKNGQTFLDLCTHVYTDTRDSGNMFTQDSERTNQRQ